MKVKPVGLHLPIFPIEEKELAEALRISDSATSRTRRGASMSLSDQIHRGFLPKHVERQWVPQRREPLIRSMNEWLYERSMENTA
jgi:hypothetical protein